MVGSKREKSDASWVFVCLFVLCLLSSWLGATMCPAENWESHSAVQPEWGSGTAHSSSSLMKSSPSAGDEFPA